jgi:L,D-peptidoglycan transpeptidase YkuD (ErfK/YbiS/YcfS/YnhG family)
MNASKHENVRLKPTGGVRKLRVRLAPAACADRQLAFIEIGAAWIRCSVGRGGFTRRKREGDGATPVGRFQIVSWRFQPVRPALPHGRVGGRLIRRDDGWCDDPASGAYNRQVRLPFPRSYENLWRDDGKYAVVGVMNYNLRPRRAGAGSAIFFHICDDDFGPTAGCIALRREDMRRILPRLASNPVIEIIG